MNNYEYLTGLPLKAFAKELETELCLKIQGERQLCEKGNAPPFCCYACVVKYLQSEHKKDDNDDIRLYQG
ncbi:MAG: hypothetical protein IJ766_03845 [Clostridia bacterium]|nr:hypothetical protein [Clostridia bacterium]